MKSNYQDIIEFHTKYGLDSDGVPKLLDKSTAEFRIKFMQEELYEFIKANNESNLEDMADALIDLVYVAMGTAYMMGLPWQDLWDEVQSANMRKVRAQSASESKRGTKLDVVKPKDWVGPDIGKIIRGAK